MRRGLPALLLVLLMAGPPRAQAQGAEGAIDPAAFEALSTGRTLTFALDGRYYGAEQYLPGRQVIWRLGQEACIAGEWFARGEAICFVYEAADSPQCWRFRGRGGQIDVTSLAGDMELQVTGNSDQPLACPGPDTGV